MLKEERGGRESACASESEPLIARKAERVSAEAALMVMLLILMIMLTIINNNEC